MKRRPLRPGDLVDLVSGLPGPQSRLASPYMTMVRITGVNERGVAYGRKLHSISVLPVEIRPEDEIESTARTEGLKIGNWKMMSTADTLERMSGKSS